MVDARIRREGAGVAAADFCHEHPQTIQIGPHLGVAARIAELLLQLVQRCLAMLDKAQEMAGTSPNLDIYKQKILLLMRMNKQAQAADILKEYITLLSAYEGQGIEGTEKEWTNKEIGWANQMLDRISRI